MLPFLPALAFLTTDPLLIDPMLLVQAAETWSVLERPASPVWPSWKVSKTPLLFYLPGKQDVLINHPKPPEGFKPYNGPLKSSLGKIWIKNGPTIFEFDGQNTSTDVNGVQTLVVADTLSNRKQWIESLVGAGPEAGAKQIENGIQTDPYGAMGMIAHEAFHVFQHQAAPQKGANELALTKYPTLSVENNVGVALEADFLAQALRGKTPADAREAAVKWLAVRHWRRKELEKSSIDYEDGTEFNEGLAKYIEFRLLEACEKAKPGRDIWLMQGFRGYEDLAPQREGLIRQMQGFLTGASVVNNDPYGASPVRFRLYYSGMGVAGLLDRLGANWKPTIFKPEATLSGLAEAAIHASETELAEAWKAVEASPRFAELKRQKEKLAEDGAAHVQEVLAGFDLAPGELVIDYSKLAKPRVGFAFTPFGILRIDEDRTIFRLLPIRGVVGALKLSEDGARPVLHDTAKKQVRLMLTGAPDSNLAGAAAKSKLTLPGATLEEVTGTIRVEGRRIVVELSDPA